MTQIIDGKQISQDIRQETAAGIQKRLSAGLRPPGLAVILVGENPASKAYVGSKIKTCAELGIQSFSDHLSADISEQDLLERVRFYNHHSEVDGILVQMPLPVHINPQKVIETIDYRKDVDGFHPINAGRLVIGDPSFVPCTPAGILEMLTRSGNRPDGKHAVVIGRSNIVGKPMANLLLQKSSKGNATVTVCHTGTKNMKDFTRQADILIVAAGSVNSVTPDMIKPGVVIIDVGMNRVPDSSKPTGHRLTGDVDYEGCFPIASAITPVPGGVGPMTIAMLMKNTLASANHEIYS